MRRTALTALVALMVVLAGCGATSTGTPTTSRTQTDDSTLEPTTGSYDGPTGTIAFYVSDQPAAIEDFEHLNVTITEIGLKPTATDGEDDGAEVETESEESETDDDENSSTTTVTTVTADGNETNDSSTDTATTTVNTTTTTNSSTTTEEPEAGSEDTETDEEGDGEDAEPEAKEDDDGDDNEEAGWVTYEVDDRTVDLTELQGANATRLANLEAPNGTYTTVFVYVSAVEGTLKNGESVNVKLPSQKLQLHTTFTIGPDTETEFVYDIAVHKAGNSGKYILKPNIAESGTAVEIDDIDEKGDEMDDEMDGDEHKDENASMEGMDEDHDENEGEMDEEMNESEDHMPDSTADERENETADGEHMGESHGDDGPESDAGLQVSVYGNVTANESVTIEVTNADGSGVPGATVVVNEDALGTTGPDGTVSYTVPSDVEELEIEAVKGQHEGEFEIAVE